MSFQRGDVIYLPFIIPYKKKAEDHPAIIVSNEDVHNSDDMYICVMISHSDVNEMFSMELRPDMFVNPTNIPTGAVKCHLITYALPSHISANHPVNRMKSIYVDKIVDFISDNVLKELN